MTSLTFLACSMFAAAVALVVIADELRQIRRFLQSGRLQGPPGPQGIPGPPGEAQPIEHPVLDQSGARKDLAEVLKRQGAHWAHYAWVQVGTADYDGYSRDPDRFKILHHGGK